MGDRVNHRWLTLKNTPGPWEPIGQNCHRRQWVKRILLLTFRLSQENTSIRCIAKFKLTFDAPILAFATPQSFFNLSQLVFLQFLLVFLNFSKACASWSFYRHSCDSVRLIDLYLSGQRFLLIRTAFSKKVIINLTGRPKRLMPL